MSKKTRIDIHQQVTDRFIAALEAGTRPWQCEWLTALPKRSCGTDYRGMNILLLGMSAAAQGFNNPTWMTFKQAKALGGAVRKGEKSTPIIFYKKLTIDAPGDPKANENGEKSIPMLRSYNVFNVDQIDGLPADKFMKPEAILSDDMRDAIAEEALRSCGADIREGGSGAFYRPSTDTVHMPDFALFTSVSGYLATLAHELTHWTGAKHRLDRVKGVRHGDAKYAFEELVAEIGAAFICARLGVAGDHFESHAAYVASWLQALKNDKKMIFKAAALAQSAADMVLENAGAGAPGGEQVAATPPQPKPATIKQPEPVLAKQQAQFSLAV